jgi:hypothetical protein
VSALAALAALAAAVTAPAQAQTVRSERVQGATDPVLSRPSQQVVLTIAGSIRKSNDGAQAAFDMAMLNALPQHTVTTAVPWDKTVHRYSGPLLRDVLALADARGTVLRARALNNYEVRIPFDDVVAHDVVLATRLDGEPITVRNKGPLFVMYPFDREPSLRSTLYFARCIWQLQAIEVQ